MLKFGEARREAKRKQMEVERQVRTRLLEEFAEAAVQADTASAAFCAAMSEIPNDIPRPDRIHSASRELWTARKTVMKAESRLNDFVRLGIIPEDLKQRKRE